MWRPPGPSSATRFCASGWPRRKKSLTFRGQENSMKVCLCWRSSGVEQLPCKQRVGGSNPLASSRRGAEFGGSPEDGEVPKWPKGADCKSAGTRLRGFKSSPPHHLVRRGVRTGRSGGNSSAVERQPSKLGVAGSNPVSRSIPRGAARRAHVAQSAEHVLGKDGVTGSSPVMGSSGTIVGGDRGAAPR